MSLSPSDHAKRAAAERALEMVEDGMMLGLGTGSTAGWFVRLLSDRIRREGLGRALGVEGAGVEAGEAEDHRAVGGVALAGEGEAAVQAAAEARRRPGAGDAVVARAQRREETARRHHRSHGVRGGGPDADLEDVEDAEEHGSRSLGLPPV